MYEVWALSFLDKQCKCTKAYHVPHITGIGGIFAQSSKTTVQRCLHRVLTLNPKYVIHEKNERNRSSRICVINWLFCKIITTPLFIFGKYRYFSTF
jgi:hypothetical protein